MSKWIVDIHGEIESDFDLICKAESTIPLDKVKQVREELQKCVDMLSDDTIADLNTKIGLGLALEKIDKLIEESERGND